MDVLTTFQTMERGLLEVKQPETGDLLAHCPLTSQGCSKPSGQIKDGKCREDYVEFANH